MAGQLLAQSEEPGFGDTEVLDQFEIPFGVWIDQAVDWTTLNLEWLLDAIEWPFKTLLNLIVRDFLEPVPWIYVVVGMFFIALLARNLTVATFTAVGLTICGLLGDAYWLETARTIGFIAVAVVLCVIIGIPIGIICGRSDPMWNGVRPVLDAMQVIHSFVYMLPFIYFFGVGRVGSTMATMVFALPPLIRLTNLGIRQVPEDVVEASRAYGAPELRVLRDVQLPLARPAILTGINQTLLLAFSMLGIAAIMGAGGLGRLLFEALGKQDAALAASGGLAFFLIAVILDRIAQPATAGQKSLFSRLHTAWRATKTPETLLGDPEFDGTAKPAPEAPKAEAPRSPVSAAERGVIMGVGGGAVLMIISLFLTWGQDAGVITGYSRRTDEDLAGQSFNGWDAIGGSWFGIFMLLCAITVIAACASTLRNPGEGARWLRADGALIAAIGGFGAAFAYFIANPSDLVVSYSNGIGVYVALIGGIVAIAAAVRWVMMAPHSPARPLKAQVYIGPIVVGVVAVLLGLGSMYSSWTLDQRADTVITPELQERIDEIRAEAAAGELEPAVAASELIALQAEAQQGAKIVTDGKSSTGAGLGIWTLILAVGGLAGAAVTSGVLGIDDRLRWIAGSVTMGIGAAILTLSAGWVATLTRATDPNYTSGVGVMMAMITGVLIISSVRSIVAEFERSKVYGAPNDETDPVVADEVQVDDSALV